ncbi:hypothetical protein ACA910_000464 [Epithemia clementina (nom. ined.)]
MVVSDEIKSMIVRKAQQLKMSIDRVKILDGEEGHRLVTNWLEILDNWQSDPQNNNFLRVIDCVQIQFDGVTWVARLERKIMDKLGLKYIPASVKRYDELRWRKSIESEKSVLRTRLCLANPPIPPQHLQKGDPKVTETTKPTHSSHS